MVSLVCMRSSTAVQLGLKFGVALFDGGNLYCQDSLYDFLTAQRDNTPFFHTMRRRLKRAIDEIKQRRAFLRRQQELERERTEWGEEYDDEPFQREEYEESSFVWEVLRLLQLMCEGHNPKMQVFLCVF